MTQTLPPAFVKALEKEKDKYALWYADQCLSLAEEMDEPECGYNQRGWQSRNKYRIYAPGEYEHGELSMKGEDLYNEEYADKADYFDLAAQAFYASVQAHIALEKLDPGAYDHMSPADFAFEAIHSYDTDMDLPGIILTVWEGLDKS